MHYSCFTESTFPRTFFIFNFYYSYNMNASESVNTVHTWSVFLIYFISLRLMTNYHQYDSDFIWNINCVWTQRNSWSEHVLFKFFPTNVKCSFNLLECLIIILLRGEKSFYAYVVVVFLASMEIIFYCYHWPSDVILKFCDF